MISYMKAEVQKMKRTFSLKLLWMAPLAALLCACFSGLQNAGYYYWYATFLPGALTIICSMVILKDAKMKYRSVFSLPVDKSAIMIGKIMACSELFLISCIVFVLGITLVSCIVGQQISFIQGIIGSGLLFITFLWQIPLCLFLSAKCGIYITILLNMLGNVIGGAVLAHGGLWYAFPYAISIRLMCPVLHILPNGLPVEKGSYLLNRGVILPGVIISLVLFVILAMLSMVWFGKQEAK